MSISFHKNGLVSSHQSVGKWLIFYVFCSENILTKLVATDSLLVSVSIWNRWLEVEPFRFHVNCIHFRRVVFVHVGRHNFVRKMVFRFTWAVLWKLHG